MKIFRVPLCSFFAIAILSLWLRPVCALEFEFGTLDFNYYTDYYYDYDYGDIDVVNTTGSQGSYIPGVDFINGELTFQLATSNSGNDLTSYHLVLGDLNNNNAYDPLTGMYYSSNDTNTYTDGENVTAIAPGKSLFNLVKDPDNTQTLIPYYTGTYNLYIRNINFTGQVQLANFSTTINGITYSYNGLLDISATLFGNNWSKVEDVAGQDGSSIAIKGDIPASPSPAPVPEPATIFLLSTGLVGIFIRRRFNK